MQNDPNVQTHIPDYSGLFSTFRLELQKWSKTGKEPLDGDQDVQYFLDLQEKRLHSHGLTMTIQMSPVGDVLNVHQVTSNFVLTRHTGLSRFNQATYYQQTEKKVSYFAGDKEIYSRESEPVFYETILSPDPDDHTVGSMPYLCPNCGAISTLDTLQQEGCPYCKTRYLMKDLYPKVSNFYYIETGPASTKEINGQIHNIFRFSGKVGIGIALFMLIFSPDHSFFSIISALFSGVLFFGIGSFILYLGLSAFYAAALFIQAGKSIEVLRGSAGSKDRITKKLRKFDPSFDYEYFEGKALSLARIIMLSDSVYDCVQYEGPDITGRFADIVDIEYRGGIGVRSIRQHDHKVRIKLDLYLTISSHRGNKIRMRDEKIRMTMYHDADFPVDKTFSIMKVQCSGCGGSFDARKLRTCPHCGRPYLVATDDWVVTALKR